MADPRNPYMPTGLDRLSTMLMALGAGVSNAESRGQSGWAGIGPAAAMYGQANQQANQQAMQYGMWQQQQEEQRAHRGVQEENIRSQIAQREAEGKTKAGMTQGVLQALGGGGAPPGFGQYSPQPTIGPGPELLKEGPQKVAYMTEKHGLPPVASAGLIGNLYQESTFNPTVVGDNGTAFGLAQWRGDRQTALKAFAQSQGKQPSDPMVQLDFIAHEGKNGDMGAQRAWAMLQTAKTPQDATTALMHYFRPAGYTPNNPTGGHAYNNRVQYAQALMPGAGGGAAPPNAQGQGDAAGGGAGGVAEPQLDPQTVQMIRAIAISDPAKAAQMLVEAKSKLKKEDAYEPLTDKNASMYLGPGYDPNKTYQRNKVSGKIEVISERKKLDAYTPIPAEEAKTILGPGFDPKKTYQRNDATGKIEPIGGSLVNIDMQSEGAFTKQVAEQDAKRLGAIQENTGSVLDTVAKVRSAANLLSQTYTGPGADYANAWHKTLGVLGVESARDKADAATAAMAIIADLKPRMRVAGSGTSTDKDMDIFGASIPSLLNLPGGNEKVAEYWERIASRAMAVQDIAEKHAMESKRLTGTTFSKEVQALGPLFSKEEIAEMQRVTKAGGKAEAASPPAASGEMPTINSPAEAAKLPKGTRFRDPSGVVRVVP
jgi:hypothetical protein